MLEWRSIFLTLYGKCTIVSSLAASSVWHFVKVYPPEREIVDTLKKAMWKFNWCNKIELVRCEVCTSDLTCGSLKALDIELKSKSLLIPRVIKFLDDIMAPWKDLMRYYITVNRITGRKSKNSNISSVIDPQHINSYFQNVNTDANYISPQFIPIPVGTRVPTIDGPTVISFDETETNSARS